MAIGGQYTLNIKGVLDVAGIRRQLDAIGKTAKLNIGTATGATGGKTPAKGLDNIADSTKKVGKQTGIMNAQLGKSAKHFGQIMGKVALFGGATAIIGGVTNGIKDMVHQVFELDKSLTELKKVSDLQGDSLEAFTDKAYEAGKEVARTGREMIDSATIFKKSGFTEDEALQLGVVAEKFRNIADAELTAQESAGFLIATMKGFKLDPSQAETIINMTNEVANNFALGTNDIQLALSKASSALGTLGNDLSESIGLITAGTEVMVGQPSKVARGLRTIGINISKLASEQDKWVSANGKVDVSLKDQEGNLRSTFDIMKDLSPQWDKLTKAEQTELAQSIAGKRFLLVQV